MATWNWYSVVPTGMDGCHFYLNMETGNARSTAYIYSVIIQKQVPHSLQIYFLESNINYLDWWIM
jgi:hypothetical protein